MEISEAKTGIAGEQGLNFITTSHTRNSEFGMSHLFTSQLYNGYTIRELNHTHPNGQGTPSGQSEFPRWGDKGFAADINDYLKITKRSYPLYHVYLIANKIYYQFRP